MKLLEALPVAAEILVPKDTEGRISAPPSPQAAVANSQMDKLHDFLRS